jgi:iron-sulfur cluster assembly protein
MTITLTEKAAQRVRDFLARRGKGEGLRVSLKSTGCSGMSYVVEYADAVAANDQVFESHGVKVIVDPKNLVFLDGTEIDYTREGLNEGFRFNNPNEKARCGCGESFNI